MATYMPPIARKKRVPEKYNPDTFRVVSLDAECYHPKFPDAVIRPVYDSDPRPARKLLPGIPVRETRIMPHSTFDFRAHNPHPVSCGFLRHNAHLLNEPVCTVYTRTTHPEQHLWWPSRTSSEPLQMPGYTRDTIYRKEYQFADEKAPKGSSRHTANPNKDPALGSVPVNFLLPPSRAKRIYNEGISFEHQYDSRADPNYPIRSKRHGAFVWDQVKPDKAQLLIDYHESVARRRAAEEFQQTSDLQPEAPPGPALSPQMTLNPLADLTPVNTLVNTSIAPVPINNQVSNCMAPSPPSPPVWPYPVAWHSPSPPNQAPQIDAQGGITPDGHQSANLEAVEIKQKDVADSTLPEQ